MHMFMPALLLQWALWSNPEAFQCVGTATAGTCQGAIHYPRPATFVEAYETRADCKDAMQEKRRQHETKTDVRKDEHTGYDTYVKFHMNYECLPIPLKPEPQ